MNGTFKGVVDRVVDGESAVILLEEDGDVIEQLDVPIDRLPEPGQEDGAVLSVKIEDGEFVTAEYRAGDTSERRQSAGDRLDRLSERLADRE